MAAQHNNITFIILVLRKMSAGVQNKSPELNWDIPFDSDINEMSCRMIVEVVWALNDMNSSMCLSTHIRLYALWLSLFNQKDLKLLRIVGTESHIG